jgi:NADPH2:quinone reductase
MLAMQVHEFGGPDQLRAEEIADPAPATGQVRIAVASAGVHLMDVASRSGRSLGPFGPPTLPMVPGREVAGVVDAVGDGVDADRWLGARVVANLGPAGGGYAELAVAPADALHPLPDGMSFDDAVAMIATGAMALAILELGAPTADDVAVVTAAAGGIGTVLIQELRRAGTNVVALVGDRGKLAVVDDLGARWSFSYVTPDWRERVRAAVGHRPITLACDGVGGDIGRGALELLSVGGRLIMYGEASGSICPLTGEDLFLRGVAASAAAGARLLNRPGGLRPLENRVLTAVREGILTPVIGRRFPLAEAAEAHRAVEARSTIGKTLLYNAFAGGTAPR